MPTKNDCKQCIDFDAETKRLMAEIFSQDELMLLSMLLIFSIDSRKRFYESLLKEDINRLAVKRDIDFSGTILGKFLVAFDTERLAFFKQQALKMKLTLDIRNECPHMKHPHPNLEVIAPPPDSL